MTTAEATISMFNRLSEDEMLDVQKYIKRIFNSRKEPAMKMYNKKEMTKILDKSIEQAKQGKTIPYKDAMEEIHTKYDL